MRARSLVLLLALIMLLPAAPATARSTETSDQLREYAKRTWLRSSR